MRLVHIGWSVWLCGLSLKIGVPVLYVRVLNEVLSANVNPILTFLRLEREESSH